MSEDIQEEASIAGARSDSQRALLAAALWCKGSSRHFSSRCVACNCAHSDCGCKQGTTCEFCHLPRTHPDKAKWGENRRTCCEPHAAAVAAALPGADFEGGGIRVVANAVGDGSTYLRSLLLGGVEGQAEAMQLTHTAKIKDGSGFCPCDAPRDAARSTARALQV